MSNLKIFTENIEQEAVNQINTLLEQPAFSNCKVRIMPDVHAGAGCVIGFTANLGDKVIPNIVGVDIGCGMLVVPLENIEIDYEKLDNVIREHIPYGREVGDKDYHLALEQLKCYDKLHDVDRLKKSMGSLGGGNHFIEVDQDEEGNKYLIIHTGSRNLGKQVADIYQNIAIKKCHSNIETRNDLIKKMKEEGREKEIAFELRALKKTQISVPKELCYLEGEDRENYLHDMRYCQAFASNNRRIIALRIVVQMGWKIGFAWESVHNYIDEDNMIRKGAIAAHKGQKVIIPMNMRDGCIIGIGKGNEDWNYSAPHGAGRIMSRSKAREQVSLEDFENSMQGIYTTSVSKSTIDESPMAYKPMAEIIENIKDTVEIEKIIKPVYNFKADE